MYKQNPLTNCDSYKLGHMAQYPDGTTKVYSNFTARSDLYLLVPSEYKKGKIVFFGIQAVIQEMTELWDTEFFSKEIEPIISEFERRIAPFVGPTGFDLNKIRELHEFQKLPIKIRALPEGSRVNIGVPVFLIENTDPRFYWITNFLETWLSSELWKMSVSATIADVYRHILTDAAHKTGAPLEFVDWQAHDFSMRGMSGIVDAAKSGAAHLTSFTGTDCLPAVDYLEQFYSGKEIFIGGSVPATEHSVMCMGGKDDELETFRRLIEDIYPSGVVSIVSDTWDFWKVLTEYSVELKDKILNRIPDQLGLAKVVFRPDSGDPVKILTGYTESEIYEAERNGKSLSSEELIGAVEVLWNIFGGTYTAAGYRVLNQHVGLIYGDSITPTRCLEIMRRLELKGFASCNVVMGIGSYTYQYNTRDTVGFAMKATYGEINGEPRAIFKSPKTDSSMKRSAKGLLKVVKTGDDFILIDNTDDIDDSGALEVIFADGVWIKKTTLAEIRMRLKQE
jgi:nicotinamide phosphoribosyltransferase